MVKKPILILSLAVLVMYLFGCEPKQSAENAVAQASETLDTTENETDAAEVVEAIAKEMPAETSNAQAAERALAFIQKHLYSESELQEMDADARRYQIAEYDLNDDGNQEVLMTIPTQDYCGSGGCSMWVLNHQGKLISKTSTVDFPIGISKTKTNGWFDLFSYSNRAEHVLKFDGKVYSSNASTATVISEEERKSNTQIEVLLDPFQNFSTF